MPRKDRTFTNRDLTRFACRNLGPEEQAEVVHNLIESDCFSIKFTANQVEKIVCQHMDISARRELMKRLITGNPCDGENKSFSCGAVEAIRTAIDALTILTAILSLLAAILPLLRAITGLFTWLVRLVAWLDRIFERIGVLEKYLKKLAFAIVALSEFLDYLAELCEEPAPPAQLDTTALNNGLSEMIAELSVVAEDGGVAIT